MGIAPFEPCAEFDEAFEPHLSGCSQCKAALTALQEVEWRPNSPIFCKEGIGIFNSHLNNCEQCASGTSAYLQQLTEAFMELNDKPSQ